MRVTLPESNRQQKRGLAGTSMSVVLHAGLIGSAIAATGVREIPVKHGEILPRVVYVKPADKPPRVPPPPRERPPTPPTVRPNDPQIETPDPHEVIVVDPRVIPVDIPPTSVTLGAIPDAPVGPPKTIAGELSGHGAMEGTDHGPFTALTVEREVRMIGSVQLRYPSMLQSAGIGGAAVMQYVVDTLGQVEKGSVRVIDASHPLFAQAARDALQRARFSPAEAGGRKVRQLVEQRFGFEVK